MQETKVNIFNKYSNPFYPSYLVKKDKNMVKLNGHNLFIDDLWPSYQHLLAAQPLLTKAIPAGILIPIGDTMAQLIEQNRLKQNKNIELDETSIVSDSNTLEDSEEKMQLDFARIARFAVFGLTLQAPWNHYYFQFVDTYVPSPPTIFSPLTIGKVIFDQFVQAPFITSIIFMYFGFLEGKSWEESLRKTKAELWPTLVANWKLWVPATVVNFAACPPEYRVLFTNVVFLGWSVLLSIIINREIPVTDIIDKPEESR